MPNIAPNRPSNSMLHVAVAVIVGADDRVLISQRHQALHQGGLWEFPGGKVEAGESVQQALVRELNEELGIHPKGFRPLITIPHHYREYDVWLDVWLVNAFEGEPVGLEGQPLKWVERHELSQFEFPAANTPIIKAVQLPDRLYITPEPGDSSQWGALLERVDSLAQNGAELILLRSKQLDAEAYLSLARMVVEVTSLDGCKVLLNSHWQDVMECNAAGLHTTSSQLHRYSKDTHREGLILSTSCHSQQELCIAAENNVDFALLSPVKKTASHPDAKPLGWNSFQDLISTITVPVYALGGMTTDDINTAWNHGAQGIAAIRSLWGDHHETN